MSQHDATELCGYKSEGGTCSHPLSAHSDDGYCFGCIDDHNPIAPHYFETRQPSDENTEENGK